MKFFPTHNVERKLRKQGYKIIAGIDEAGKGALAGPIVAGCVVLPEKFKNTVGIADSKKLTPKKREELYVYITKHALSWSVGIVDNKTIDKIGIKQANILAFEKAIYKIKTKIDYIIIDGQEMKIDTIIPHHFVVKGDQKSISIAAASIIAKFTRDFIMDNHHKSIPDYDFISHKGYGTLKHMASIKKHGASSIHRKKFKPSLYE